MDHRYHTERRELWHLDVATGSLYQAGLAWQWLAETVRSRWSNLASSDTRLYGTDWSGETRFAFDGHRRRLFNTLEAAAEQADHLHTDLRSLADTAIGCQRQLDEAYYRIARYEVAAESTDEHAVFRIPVEKYDEFVELLEQARAVRKGFDNVLGAAQFTGDGIWEELSRSWEPVATGTADPFLLPEGVLTTSMLEVDGTTVINTGSGDDNVKLTRDPDTGHVLATVNGVVHDLGSGASVIIRTGTGNDTVEIGPDVTVKLVLGGKGSDTIAGASTGTAMLGGGGDDRLFGATHDQSFDDRHDYLSGNGGNDYIEGRGGDDLILGGSGGDVIYAGAGSDDVLPGEGSNYADAGADDDRVFARWDARDDLDAGGSGEDLRTGGVGWEYFDREDVVDPASASVDSVVSHPPRDRDLSFIKIEGSPEFIARVQDDLHTLSRTYNSAAGLLDSGFTLWHLEQNHNGNFLPGGHSLTIREAPMDATANATTDASENIWGNRNTVIYYNPVKNAPLDPESYAGPASPAVDLMRELHNEAREWRGGS